MELCTLLYYKVQRSFFFSFIFSYNPALFGPIIPAYTFAVKISCDTSQRRAHLSFIFLPHPPELGEGLPDGGEPHLRLLGWAVTASIVWTMHAKVWFLLMTLPF